MKRGQIRRWTTKGIISLLAVVFCIHISLPVEAAAAAPRLVRIPCNFNDFLRVDQNGGISGYYAEYLEKLAEVNNWKYEYVDTTWSNALNMLENGEIDFSTLSTTLKIGKQLWIFPTCPSAIPQRAFLH